MMGDRLTPADINAAAARLGCRPVVIHAALIVETGGAGGFLADGSGRPRILFEAHVFSRLTRRRFDAGYPDISSPTWNRSLYRGGAAEYERLSRAAGLDSTAAYLSASWGLFQPMGFNFAPCGFTSVNEMVARFSTGERPHLDGFLSFCEATGCADELAREDFDGYARIYNGAGYLANDYAGKLRRAVAEAVRTGVAAGQLASAPELGIVRSPSFPEEMLRIGQRGEAVSRLQARLNLVANAGLVTDGIFGRATELAVERYQAANGLVVDGIVGPKTLEALNL